MKLEDLEIIKDWTSQFDVPDVYVVEQILSNMRFVSFEEVETWLQNSITQLLAEIQSKDGRSNVAIFPVNKPFINKFNKDKEVKQPNDSSGRIAHSLKNLERKLPTYVELTPRLTSMRDKKVRNIIFVDDFVGTGDRFIKSWRETVHPTIKSWCSRGWCKVWFVTFAAHESGLQKISHNIRSIPRQNVRVNLPIKNSFMFENGSMKAVLKKYGANLGTPKQTFGYGGLASPVVFQYGCPNNVPLIFWVRSGKKSGVNLKPLFPNRSIPTDAYGLFNKNLKSNASAQNFWDKKRYDLALNFLEDINRYDNRHYQLIMALTLLADNNDKTKINNIMLLSSTDLDEILTELKDGGVIDAAYKPTRFGHDIINRIAKKRKVSKIQKEEGNFYPSTFLGFRRET
ncbi:phosphoribosyltransferase-like protein [Mixta calida]|uniref:phosphoribosyltransferase-like protein n=1 Tax=Mixta calida TaxID=665913 RepID=UPI00403AD4F9